MKKFVFTAIFILLAICINFLCIDVGSAFSQDDEIEVKTYFTQKPAVVCDVAYPYFIVNKNVESDKAVGKSFSFKYDKNKLNKILSAVDARKIYSEKIGGIEVCCFYSGIFKNKVQTSFGDVNMQVAISNGIVTIGIPLILGSF